MLVTDKFEINEIKNDKNRLENLFRKAREDLDAETNATIKKKIDEASTCLDKLKTKYNTPLEYKDYEDRDHAIKKLLCELVKENNGKI